MRTWIIGALSVSSLLILSGCSWTDQLESSLTWRSPTRLCSGRFMVYPELVKLKVGPRGQQQVRYGGEITARLEC